MSSIDQGLYEVGRLDQLAAQDTAIHRVDPRAKVVVTIVFLVCVVSFGRYDVLALLPFALFPIVMASEGRIPLGYLASRLAIAAPFAVMVGLFNPVIDRTVIGYIGQIPIAAGWVSYLSIIVRFLLTTAAALVLIGTTSFIGVCMAIERLGAPDVFAVQLLFLYRYIFVLGEEAARLSRARALRSFGRRGMGLRVYGEMLGQLLLRTYARASRIYQAMLCRGFDGHVRTLRQPRFTARDAAFVAIWCALFIAFRVWDVPALIGRLATGGF